MVKATSFKILPSKPRKKKEEIKLTNDNMILALNEYVRVFNSNTPKSLGSYVEPSRMSHGALKLHFDALEAAFRIIGIK